MQVLVECHNKNQETKDLLGAVLSAALGCRASLKQGLCNDQELIAAKDTFARLGPLRTSLSINNKTLSAKAAQSLLDNGCFALGLKLSGATTTDNDVATYFYNHDLAISVIVRGVLAEPIDLPLSQTPNWGYHLRLFAHVNQKTQFAYFTTDLLPEVAFEISTLDKTAFIFKKTTMTTNTLPVTLYLGEIELTAEQIAAVRNGAAVKISYNDNNGKLRGILMTGSNVLRKGEIEIQGDNTFLITERTDTMAE